MGIIYPNRADNEAYIAERVNLGPIKDYLSLIHILAHKALEYKERRKS